MKNIFVFFLTFIFFLIPLILPAQNFTSLDTSLSLQSIEILNTSISLDSEQMMIFDKVVYWKNMSMIGLGINTVSLLVTVAVDPVAGGILSILSLGYWSFSTGMMSFGYRDLLLDMDADKAFTFLSDAPPFKTGAYAALGAYSFGIGAITAIGLSFDDYTGTAETLAYICTAISSISGIAAIINTSSYSKSVGYEEYKKQLAYVYEQSYHVLASMPQPGLAVRDNYSIKIPLIRYSF